MLYFPIFIIFTLICNTVCLNNGLARTPPMGWLSWERFQCNTKCDTDPENCISEKLFMQMADLLITEGYHDAGYKYVNIDDCWMAHTRDSDGNMVADPDRFPRGIRFLSEYMHANDLKLGIYQDFGTHTCMGFPGIIGHMEQDAKKFEEWDVDMLKLDACHSHLKELNNGYIEMGSYLQSLNKSILYSCSWPYYQLASGMDPDYSLIAEHCNLWRNFHDIHDKWESIEEVIEFFGDNQEVISQHIGPGHWSDPDMLMIGNDNLTPGQSRAQMAVWSMIPGPLLMSNDLRRIKPESKSILLNRRVIAINQDPMGIPGKRIYMNKKFEIWSRKIQPSFNKESSYALLFLNRHKVEEVQLKFTLAEMDMRSKNGYNVTEVFDNVVLGIFKPIEIIKISVLPMDVKMLNCAILT